MREPGVYDVFISGNGPVGSALALALARQGLRVALRGAEHAPHAQAAGALSGEVRAYALNEASIALLRMLRVWEALPQDARTPVYDMWVQGDEAGILQFSAWQQRVPSLAVIVDASALLQALHVAVGFSPHIQRVQAESPSALHVLAEGRDATGLAALGVQRLSRPYGQHAVATRLVGQHAHAGLARQWFRSPDVLALLPLDRPQPGRSWALVWSLPQTRAQELHGCDVQTFERALQEATGGAVGPLHLAGPRAAWPLSLSQAEPLCGTGWVLVGDAAHGVHPLAGQGLNLGFADVASLSAVLQAREPWRALGDARLLRRYARERRLPTWAMSAVTDGLLHLFADPRPVVRMLRNRGLAALNLGAPLKSALAGRALRS